MQKEKKTRKKLANSYSVYSEALGLVFQMFFIILIGILFGRFLDGRLLSENSDPWFTILLSLVSFSLATYLMIKKFGGNK